MQLNKTLSYGHSCFKRGLLKPHWVYRSQNAIIIIITTTTTTTTAAAAQNSGFCAFFCMTPNVSHKQ
jgi:hypothetical protein